MFNLILRNIGKFIYKNPTIHVKPPKMAVINYSNSINSNPTVLSLENITSISFFVELEKVINGSDCFNLFATINKNQTIEKIKLATFDNKKDADNALYLLIYKLYSPLRGFYKTILTIIFVGVLSIVGKDILTSLIYNNSPETLSLNKIKERTKISPEATGQILPNVKNPIANPTSNPTTGSGLPDGFEAQIAEQAKKIIEDQNKLNEKLGDNGISANNPTSTPAPQNAPPNLLPESNPIAR